MKRCIALLLVFFSSPLLPSSLALEDFILKYKITTIEQFVENFQPTSNFLTSLIYRSQSPQVANLKKPRFVYSDKNANFLMAFNHLDIEKNPFFTIDIFQYRQKFKEYEAMKITFDPKGKKLAKVVRDEQECLMCHTTFGGIRPNRTSYIGDIYPGFFGSTSLISKKEEKALKLFIENQFSRAQRLIHKGYDNTQAHQDTKRLGRLLNQKYFIKLSEAILENTKLSPYRYALIGSMSCHEPITEFIPQSTLETLDFSFADVEKELVSIRKQKYLTLAATRDLFLGFSQSHTQNLTRPTKDDLAATNLWFLYKNILKEDIYTSQLAHELRMSILFSGDGFGGINNLPETLYKEVFQDNLQLLKLFSEVDKERKESYSPFLLSSQKMSKACPAIKIKSKTLLSSHGVQ